MAMNAQDDPIFGIHLAMHERASQWDQYVPIRHDFPMAVKPNGTYFVLLEHNIPDYSAGLYYRTKNRWACILTGDELSQVFTVDFKIDVYYGWEQAVTIPANAKVYKNTVLQSSVTSIPADDQNIWAVLIPAAGGELPTKAENPTWPADFDDPATGDSYKPGGISEIATRDLVLEAVTDLVWVQEVRPALTTTVPKEALTKRQIVLTGSAPDELLDITHPTSILLPSGGEWGIINLCTGAGPVRLLNEKTFGSSIPLYSNCNAHIATGDYGISSVSGDIGGNAYRLPTNQAGGTLDLTTTELLYHILNIIDNPLGPLQTSLTYKFPATTPPISGTWTFSNNTTQVNPPAIFVEGSNGGIFEVEQGEAITVVHNEAGNLILVQTAVSGFFASGVEHQPTASGTSIAIGESANAVGSSDAVAIGAAATSQGSTVAIGSGAFAQDYAVAIGKGAEVSGTMLVGYGLALGYEAKAGGAAIALGWKQNPVNPTDVYIGANTVPMETSIVVLGAGSIPSSYPGMSTTHHLSVGNDDASSLLVRRITGVADGVNPHDAVNMSQIGVLSTLGTMARQDADAVAITGGSVEDVSIGPGPNNASTGDFNKLRPFLIQYQEGYNAKYWDLPSGGGTVTIDGVHTVHVITTTVITDTVHIDFSANFGSSGLSLDGMAIKLVFVYGAQLTFANPQGYNFRNWDGNGLPSSASRGYVVDLLYRDSNKTFYRINYAEPVLGDMAYQNSNAVSIVGGRIGGTGSNVQIDNATITNPIIGPSAVQGGANISDISATDMIPYRTRTPDAYGSKLYTFTSSGGTVPVTSANSVIVIDTPADTTPVTLNFSEDMSGSGTAVPGTHITLSFTGGATLTVTNPHGYTFKGWTPPTTVPEGFIVKLMLGTQANDKVWYKIG